MGSPLKKLESCGSDDPIDGRRDDEESDCNHLTFDRYEEGKLKLEEWSRTVQAARVLASLAKRVVPQAVLLALPSPGLPLPTGSTCRRGLFATYAKT